MSKRSPYTMRELKDIVNYIVHHNAYAETKARLMWQKCAATNITNRTWQSLKETFLKRILTDIANPYYKLTQEQIDSFRSGSNLHSRVHNKLEWCTSDGEAGPSNKIKNNFNVKNKKTQDGDDELMALTLEQGELADSHVCRDRREDSNSRDTLKLYSNDEGNQKENKDEINSDKTLVLDENDDTGTINCSRESSKLKDKLIFLEPLTPMMQEMITDSDICNSSDSTEVIQENEDIKEIDGSSKENKENETMENIDVIEKDGSDKKMLKSTEENSQQIIERKNMNFGNSNTSLTKKENCKNQKTDKSTPKSKVSNELKKKASTYIPSSCETQASNTATNETNKDNFESKHIKNDVNLNKVKENCIEQEIMSTTKLVNYESKLAPKNKGSDEAIVDVNEIITVQTSTRRHTKGSASKSAYKGAQIPSLSLKDSMFLKSSSDSLCSSDDIETRHATRTVRKAERSKSKGLAKVFGFASGERNLKFVSSKKYQVNQSSKAKSKKSKPNNLSVLSSWDSNSSTSDSDSNMGHESGRFRNVHQIIQPFEVKPNHIKNGMLMAICGKQMYPVIKQVGSKRHYVKWKDDGTNEITIAKKCKGSKNKHKYLTNRGEHENNNYPVYLSTSSESDSNRNSYHKMPRYITKKKTSKCRCRSETCSTPADKWRNECLLEKQRNDKLMGLLDQLLELKSGKSSLEKGQVPEDVKHSQSTIPDVQEPDQIDLTQTDPTQDNVLKISASYGNKVIQLEVKNDDPLKKVLEALNVDDKNETDAVQENQQEVIERKEVQTRVDKLEETIFNAIIELDKREEIVTPIDEEMQVVENKKTEVNLSSGSRSAVNDNNVDVSTIIEEAKIDSSKRVSKKRRGEDRSTVETHKLKKAPRSRKKDAISTTTTQENEVTTITLPTVKESETTTITLPTVQESETTTITLPTVQESETTAITLPTVQESKTTTITLPTVHESQTTTITRQESDISTASKADKKKKTKRSRQHLDKSVLEDNDLSKGVSKVENVVGKETAVEHKKHVTESMPRVNSGNDLALDVSDQEIFFTKESLSKRSSIELKSPRRLRSGQQDTSASIKSEVPSWPSKDSATSLLQSLRTRSRDHNEKKNESNRSFYPTRSQNKLMNRKKALHILQDRLSSVRNSRFTSPESAHSYVDSDLSPVLRSFHNKQKSKRKFRVTKKISIAHDLLPRSIRRSRQSNEFKKQLDLSKPSSHSVQKTIDTSAKSTSYHTTPTSKLSVNSKRVFENIPVICVNQLTSSKGTESHSTSVTETVVATAQNSNFENTPNSTGRLTPRGPDTSRSELPVSPEISFIEKITVSLNRLNPESNDLPCRSDHLTINTLDKSHPLLDQDVSFDDAKDKDWKQNENIDDSNVNNSQHSDQSSLQDSRGYASLISESLISGISNVNLSNKLSQTLEMEFTNLSLEKLQNKIHLDTCTSKEKRVTKKDKSNTKPNSSKTTRKSNWTGDDELFDIVGYNSNDENAVHTGKGKRGKKQYVKVKIVRPKHKSKNSSKISNISDNANNDYESSQNLGVPTTNISDLSVEEIVTDPQPVIVVDNDDSVLTPANTSLQLALGAEEDSCVNLTMSMQSEDILTNDELTMSPVQDTPITWYLLSDDESLDAHAYRDRSCRGSLFVLTLPSCLSARRDLDLTAITEDSNDNNARN